jgi:hypothetical protein
LNSGIMNDSFKETDIKFHYSEDTKLDETNQATIDQADLANGVITRNIRRKHVGLPPIEGGDIILVQTASGDIPIEALDDYASGNMIMAEKQAMMVQMSDGSYTPQEEQAADDKQNKDQKQQAKDQAQGKPDNKPESKKDKQVNVHVHVGNKDDAKIERVMKGLKAEGLNDVIVKIAYDSELQTQPDFTELRKAYEDYYAQNRGLGYEPEERPQEPQGQGAFSYGLKQGLMTEVAGVNPDNFHHISSENKQLAEAGVESVLGASLLVFGARKTIELGHKIFDSASGAAKKHILSWFKKREMQFIPK